MKRILLCFIVLCACNKPEQEEMAYVAKVGEQVITADEFRLNYEFGFAQHKVGSDAKSHYLDKMIAELLLAEEAFRLNMDTLAHIQHAVRTIREERLIEEVFNQKVMNEIQVSDEEIRNEINKSAVSFQFRFLPALSEIHALNLKDAAESDGYDAALALVKNDFGNAPIDPSNMKSAYVKAEDIDVDLLPLLQDLEIGTMSDPVLYRGQWYLFEVMNIRRQPLAESDYKTKSVTYQKVLYNKKAVDGATDFISNLMQEKNVKTKRAAFEVLNGAFFKWFKEEIPTGDLVKKVRTGEEVYHKEIRAILTDPLVESEGKVYSVEEWLNEFNAGRYQLRPDSYDYFTGHFADVVALVIRDKYLLEIADSEKMDDDPLVQRDIRQWENKWLFQEIRGQVMDTVVFNKAVVHQFMIENAASYGIENPESAMIEELTDVKQRRIRKDYLSEQLQKKVDLLKKQYKVEINYAVLDTIQVMDDQRIPVQLMKQNSNRPAIPVVDPNW